MTGHAAQINNTFTGQPYKSWDQSIPNDGLFRYKFYGMERLVMTDPKVLAEVYAQKSYDFQKPYLGRFFAATGLGQGLVFSEGDVHKVRWMSCRP